MTEIARIALGNGGHAIIDADAVEMVRALGTWSRVRCRNTWYAITQMPGHKFRIYMHRLIMFAERGDVIDHKNGNGLDNRCENLRKATYSENAANSKLRSTNKSGYRGVFFVADRGKFVAYITKNWKRKHLGSFPTAKLAAEAYDRAACEAFGDFAVLNFPQKLTCSTCSTAWQIAQRKRQSEAA